MKRTYKLIASRGNEIVFDDRIQTDTPRIKLNKVTAWLYLAYVTTGTSLYASMTCLAALCDKFSCKAPRCNYFWLRYLAKENPYQNE